MDMEMRALPAWVSPTAVVFVVLPLYLAAGRRHGPGTAGRPPADRRVGLPLAAAMGGLAGGAASLVGHVIGVPLVLATGWTLSAGPVRTRWTVPPTARTRHWSSDRLPALAPLVSPCASHRG